MPPHASGFSTDGMTWKDTPTYVTVNVPMTKEIYQNLKEINFRAFTDGDNLTFTTDDGVLVRSPHPPLRRPRARVEWGR